ncbi:hypothetical protein EDD37DRAFT_169260 [Exophiala viscosa]|uniref:uncharacterized protein n=1 Tax=Exophiala viscosa TaxID=2486360 RepID=UPI002198A816|nr:hypothetical protein EDD37DRAFT_169260 [Exophiala viscosa]
MSPVGLSSEVEWWWWELFLYCVLSPLVDTQDSGNGALTFNKASLSRCPGYSAASQVQAGRLGLGGFNCAFIISYATPAVLLLMPLRGNLPSNFNQTDLMCGLTVLLLTSASKIEFCQLKPRGNDNNLLVVATR